MIYSTLSYSSLILKMKLRFRKVKSLALGHTAGKGMQSLAPRSHSLLKVKAVEDGAGGQCKYLPWRRKRERAKRNWYSFYRWANCGN